MDKGFAVVYHATSWRAANVSSMPVMLLYSEREREEVGRHHFAFFSVHTHSKVKLVHAKLRSNAHDLGPFRGL
jgi:hypothetical protein